MKKEIKQILKKYSCWNLEKRYGCIDDATNEIQTLLDKQREEIKQKIEKWDLGAIPRTDEYAKGWNDCRHSFGEGKKRFILKELNK